MSSTEVTRSTEPVAMAPAGISVYSGVLPCVPCAMVRPPHSLMTFSPSAPSLPVPDSTTPTARSRITWPSESKNESMGREKRCSSDVEANTDRQPFTTVTMLCGGGTYTWSVANRVPSVASTTGMVVQRCKMSGRSLG